jgi:hypothetical protein
MQISGHKGNLRQSAQESDLLRASALYCVAKIRGKKILLSKGKNFHCGGIGPERPCARLPEFWGSTTRSGYRLRPHRQSLFPNPGRTNLDHLCRYSAERPPRTAVSRAISTFDTRSLSRYLSRFRFASQCTAYHRWKIQNPIGPRNPGLSFGRVRRCPKLRDSRHCGGS